MALGSGWYPLENYRGVRFRWVKNDAILHVATLTPRNYSVRLTLEPGPGVGLKPFELSVFGEGEQLLAKPTVTGKQTVTIALPQSGPKIHSLRLHVDGAGKPAHNDPRIMNFRAFEVALERAPADVLPSWAKLGRGWYPLESFGGVSFRWVSNDAEIELLKGADKTIQFDVEPGPGVDSKPFLLKVMGGERKDVAVHNAEIGSRTTVSVDLNSQPGRVVLHVDGGGKVTPGDARILNFRVFESSESAG